MQPIPHLKLLLLNYWFFSRSVVVEFAKAASGADVQLIATLPTANYVGVFGSIEPDEDAPVRGDGAGVGDCKTRLADFRRGASQTLLIGERRMSTVPSTWLGVHLAGEDAPSRLVGAAVSTPNCSDCDECNFTSRHPGRVLFVWADGRVSAIHDNIDLLFFQKISRRLP